MFYLLGGLLILACYYLIAEDINKISKSTELMDKRPGEGLELLFYKYFIPGLGIAFTLIGLGGLAALIVKRKEDK